MSNPRQWRGRFTALGALLMTLAATAAARSPNPPTVPSTTERPKQFGIDDYVVTVIPAGEFTADVDPTTDFGSLYRYFAPRDTASGHFFHGVQVPSGAVIDFVGLQTQDNGYNSYQANLFYLDESSGTTSGIVSVDFAPNGHSGYATAYNASALGWQLLQNRGNALVIDVYQREGDPVFDRNISFGWVEIWWKRTVSPASPFPAFLDVPESDIGYQYVEALASSGITGGCSPGLFCPDAALTRRQMAVFLAKALGLHW
jgi:hypothetical protein